MGQVVSGTPRLSKPVRMVKSFMESPRWESTYSQLFLNTPSSGGLWEVATEAGPLAARYVVAADGAKGRAARQLGLELELRPGGGLRVQEVGRGV